MSFDTQLVDATPLMRQYYQIKVHYPDSLLLFQVGDFYELFFEDAQRAAQFLGITLTARGKHNGEPIPLCGVPVHTVNHYLAKLIKGGFTVALCEQLEEAKPGKMVERGVTRVLTPGTLTDEVLLDALSPSYLCSIAPSHDQLGIVFTELLTAQTCATVIPYQAEKHVETELTRFFPDEVIVPGKEGMSSLLSTIKRLGYYTTVFNGQRSPLFEQWITTRMIRDAETERINSLKPALEQLHGYLERHQQRVIDELKTITIYSPEEFLMLDVPTQKTLEIIKNTHDGGRNNTLLSVVDRAATSMGSRMVQRWFMRPLAHRVAIEERHDAVQSLIHAPVALSALYKSLSIIGDLERVIGRIGLCRGTVNDYRVLMNALYQLPVMHNMCTEYKLSAVLRALQISPQFEHVYTLLHRALNSDVTKEWIINAGYDERLDYVRSIHTNAQAHIAALEQLEQKNTGINSLKIRFNGVQGYYVEITKTHLDQVPTHYTRLQTLAGRERYTLPALMQLQAEIKAAETEIADRERELFDGLKRQIYLCMNALRALSYGLSHIDALVSIARTTLEHGYVRPVMSEAHDIMISGGQHPVVAARLQHNFIPNDTQLTDAQSTWIITGPNMGGKSTYLRQVALINIMAQAGCFVPARAAQLPILDRIFTRVGAGDNVAEGKSTFLVEMEETATICTYATKNSLVILDEVGRGTSTFDGLAIAQAVVEYIHSVVRARCLFATHYHELTALAQTPGIACYYAASTRTARGILFLYTIRQGIADGSFGIDVARLADLPPAIVNRADLLLTEYVDQKSVKLQHSIPFDASDAALAESGALKVCSRAQLALVEQLKEINLDDMSPRQAYDLLYALKEKAHSL